MSTERNPFENLEQQFEHMQRQFEKMIDMWDGEQFGVPQTGATTRRMGVDLADRGDEYVLTADVPGFERYDINLRFADDTLYITAEYERADREEADEAEETRYLKSERERRTMKRSIRLPESVDEEAVKATYQNGVLTVTLPKAEQTDVDGTQIAIDEREST